MVRLLFLMICSSATLAWSQKGEFGKEHINSSYDDEPYAIETVNSTLGYNQYSFKHLNEFASSGSSYLQSNLSRVKRGCFGYSMGLAYLYPNENDTIKRSPITELGIDAGIFTTNLVDFGSLYLSYAGAWVGIKLATGVSVNNGKKAVNDYYCGFRPLLQFHELRFYDSTTGGKKWLGTQRNTGDINFGIQPFAGVRRRWKNTALFMELGAQFDYYRNSKKMSVLPRDVGAYESNPGSYSGGFVGRPWTIFTGKVGIMFFTVRG